MRQVCDGNRQPLSFIFNGSAARFEEEFNVNEQRERIYETGFDERLVGFSAREAKFSGGTLQSVTHTHSDGISLDSVRVIITGIVPQAEQPRSAELKEEDQLIAVNGKPITSVYSWAFAGTFPGTRGKICVTDSVFASTVSVAESWESIWRIARQQLSNNRAINCLTNQHYSENNAGLFDGLLWPTHLLHCLTKSHPQMTK